MRLVEYFPKYCTDRPGDIGTHLSLNGLNVFRESLCTLSEGKSHEWPWKRSFVLLLSAGARISCLPGINLSESFYLFLTLNVIICTWPKMHSFLLSQWGEGDPHCGHCCFPLTLLFELCGMHWKYLQATATFLIKRMFGYSLSILLFAEDAALLKK